MNRTKPNTYASIRDKFLPMAITAGNGFTYRKRPAAAQNIIHGDRIAFWVDVTPGEIARWGIARVTSAQYWPDAHPWERTVLYVGEWRGADGEACALRTFERPIILRFACKSRVTVWRVDIASFKCPGPPAVAVTAPNRALPAMCGCCGCVQRYCICRCCCGK